MLCAHMSARDRLALHSERTSGLVDETVAKRNVSKDWLPRQVPAVLGAPPLGPGAAPVSTNAVVVEARDNKAQRNHETKYVLVRIMRLLVDSDRPERFVPRQTQRLACRLVMPSRNAS